jgi:hypothetical protein
MGTYDNDTKASQHCSVRFAFPNCRDAKIG